MPGREKYEIPLGTAAEGEFRTEDTWKDDDKKIKSTKTAIFSNYFGMFILIISL